MIHCGGCKHWREPGPHEAVLSHLSIDSDRTVGKCAKFREISVAGPFAFAEYGYAVFTTGDFGCVLGEAGGEGQPTPATGLDRPSGVV